MALRHRHIGPLLAVALAAVFAALAAAPIASEAGASACQKWGKASPEKLRTGQARKAVLCLVNEQRRRHGMKPLDRDKRLQRAAQRHNDKMHGTGCFAHECPGEGSLDQRLSSVNYLTRGLMQWAYGENVAWGYADRGSPESIVKAWMNSSGHRANILSKHFREIGVGFSAGTPSSRNDPGGIYTTDFGLRVG